MIKKFLVVLTVAALLVACGSKSVNPIVNTWAVSDLAFETPANDSASMAMLDKMKEMMFSMTYVFGGDGSYSVQGPNSSKTGTYTLSEDGKSLSLNDGKNPLEFEIVKLTADSFCFKSAKMPVVMTCTPKGTN